mgnify:CR=1 FL=1
MSTRQSIPASPPRRKAPVAVQLARQARHEAWLAKRDARERAEARVEDWFYYMGYCPYSEPT